MKSKSRRTLDLLFSRPTPGSAKWGDVVALFHDPGGELDEREGFRVAVYLFNQVKVLHRPHPSSDLGKGCSHINSQVA